MRVWPLTRKELIEEQARLAVLGPTRWRFEPEAQIGGVFVSFARGESGPGRSGDPGWSAVGSAATRLWCKVMQAEPGLLTSARAHS